MHDARWLYLSGRRRRVASHRLGFRAREFLMHVRSPARLSDAADVQNVPEANVTARPVNVSIGPEADWQVPGE